MAINPLLSAVSSALAQQSAPVSVRSAAATSSGSGVSTPQAISDTQPSQPVLQSASLLNASSNFAQLGSLLQVAQSGTEQISAILAQLQTLAGPAAADGSDAANIESEFQQLLTQIDQTVNNTTFGGTKLLDGTQSGSTDNQSLALPDLSTQGLFGDSTPDISTPQGAAAAQAALTQAQNTVADTGSAISAIFTQLSFASASVDTALANATAASSTLTDSDVTDSDGSSAPDALFSNPQAAAAAQTGNINATLLNLLQE